MIWGIRCSMHVYCCWVMYWWLLLKLPVVRLYYETLGMKYEIEWSACKWRRVVRRRSMYRGEKWFSRAFPLKSLVCFYPDHVTECFLNFLLACFLTFKFFVFIFVFFSFWFKLISFFLCYAVCLSSALPQLLPHPLEQGDGHLFLSYSLPAPLPLYYLHCLYVKSPVCYRDCRSVECIPRMAFKQFSWIFISTSPTPCLSQGLLSATCPSRW